MHPGLCARAKPVRAEPFRRRFETLLEGGTVKGAVLEPRTARRRAVDDEVDAGIPELRTDDPVLEVIEGHLHTSYHEILFPEEPPLGDDRHNAGHGISGNHPLQDQGVVGIDPVGESVSGSREIDCRGTPG